MTTSEKAEAGAPRSVMVQRREGVREGKGTKGAAKSLNLTEAQPDLANAIITTSPSPLLSSPINSNKHAIYRTPGRAFPQTLFVLSHFNLLLSTLRFLYLSPELEYLPFYGQECFSVRPGNKARKRGDMGRSNAILLRKKALPVEIGVVWYSQMKCWAVWQSRAHHITCPFSQAAVSPRLCTGASEKWKVKGREGERRKR